MYLAERTEETTMDGITRASELKECLTECGHTPDGIRFVRGGPSHADGVEVLFSVEDQAEAVDKGKEILDALPEDEDVPDFVRVNGAHGSAVEPEDGPLDLGLIWKGLEEPDGPTPQDTGVIWKSIEEPHGPNSAEIRVPEDQVEGTAGRWVTWHEAIGPSDFPELWRHTEDVTGMSLATLVELNLDAMEDHTLERIRQAAEEEAARRTAWDTWTSKWRLAIGRWLLVVGRKVVKEDEGEA